MSVYHELLEIKQFRETQAETEVRRHRALVAEANRSVEELEHKLEDFRQWADNHERSLFDDLCSRLVKLREIEELRHAVAELRNRERNLEQGVQDARGNARPGARALDDAVTVHTDASPPDQQVQGVVAGVFRGGPTGAGAEGRSGNGGVPHHAGRGR